MPKQKETKFKEKVLRDLKGLKNDGHRIWGVKTQMVAVRGIPDILICAKGIFVALELKSSSDAAADSLQAHTLQEIERAGGACRIVHPDNWKYVLAELRALAAPDRV